MKTTINLPLFLSDIRYLLLLIPFLLGNATVHESEIITRISINSEGSGGNGGSKSSALSADGRYIAFQSDANNLVPNDNNGFTDIFLFDQQTRQIKRINISSNGTQANFVSFFPMLSADGRYIVFQSDATNLIPDDNNKTTDIFVHEQITQLTDIVSISSNGVQGNSNSSEPVISADGRYVAFHSNATNLVKRDKNKNIDVFVHDRETGETTRVSVSSKEKEANGTSFGSAISADGRYVAFSSNASNLVKGDKNKTMDVFIHDRETKETTLISLSSEGLQGNEPSFSPSLSDDGRFIAFHSQASNLVNDDTNEVADVFIHDRDTGQTKRINVDNHEQQANELSFGARISANGRYVVFNSEANNLVDDDNNDNTDVFIRDLQTGQTRRLTLESESIWKMRASSYAPMISNDGRWVVFESLAWNLVANDLNEESDIFLYDRHYYANFEVATRQLNIPVINVPEEGLFTARLSLMSDNTPLQFTVDRINSFGILLEDIPSIYTPDIRLLQLPNVELKNPPLDTILCQVDMVADMDISVLTVIQLNCNR